MVKELRVGVSYLVMDRYYVPVEARDWKRDVVAAEEGVAPDKVSQNDCIERYIFDNEIEPSKSDNDNWQIAFVEEA